MLPRLFLAFADFFLRGDMEVVKLYQTDKSKKISQGSPGMIPLQALVCVTPGSLSRKLKKRKH